MHLFFRLPNDRDCGLLCCGPLGSVPKKLTEMHVSRQMTNLVDVEVQVDGYPEELYESSSKRFQKRVISSWTLAVEKVNLVFVVCCNMLVIDSNILQCHLVRFVSIYENTQTLPT